MTVFETNQKKSHTQQTMFLDESLGVQRYDIVKYKQFEKLTETQLGFFWMPQEIDLVKDMSDFKDLSNHERHIFTSNLKRQILLDSVQGRSPNLAFLPIVSLPELETWIETWSFFETIHSRSYTHIIRNVYSNPSVVFDDMLGVAEILACSHTISEDYDQLIAANAWFACLGAGTHIINGVTRVVDLYAIKKMLWRTLMSINILEGVRFYVSFACSWAFAELKKMEGNAKIIKLIARDENVHLASSQQMLKLLPQDDPDFAKIAIETQQESVDMYLKAIQQEKDWATYLFKDGSMIGLNRELLNQYVDWIANKRMASIGLKLPYTVPQHNPLPWTQRWIAGSEVQDAPQEVQISSYITGGTVQDINTTTFDGMSL